MIQGQVGNPWPSCVHYWRNKKTYSSYKKMLLENADVATDH